MVLSREPEAVVGAAHRRVEARRAPSPAGDGHAAAAAHVLTCARLGSGGGTGVVVFILCNHVKGRGQVRVEHVSDGHRLSHYLARSRFLRGLRASLSCSVQSLHCTALVRLIALA